MAGLDIPFETRAKDLDETWPENLKGEAIAEYLAKMKAEAFLPELKPDEILITADTIVRLGDTILNKPADEAEALSMHQQLRGKTHVVTTGVGITTTNKQLIFSSSTEVEFHHLNDEELLYYIRTCSPFDKAGAYGIQEWFGYVGIKHIRGDFFNVMGLPVNQLYFELKKLLTLD